MAAPLRSEIDDEYKWAVNDIYSSDEAWNTDYEKIMNMAKEPCKYAGSIAESYEKLYQVLKEISDTDYIVERVYVYAFMKYYEDTTNSVYQEMSGKAQVAAVKMSEKYAFAEPEILRMDADDEIIGYKFINFGKMMDFIKAGDDANTAFEKASGQYGRVADAVKIVDPRKE